MVAFDARHVALSLDSERKPVEAAWAYEIALTKSDATLELLLNLVAIYLAACDPGYRAHYTLDARFVDGALERAQELLADATQRFGEDAESAYWSLALRDFVLGEPVKDVEYEGLRELPNSEVVDLVLFLRTGESRFVLGARQFLDSMGDGETERARYFLGFRERLAHIP